MSRRRDHGAVKADAQAIYQATSRSEAEDHAGAFARRWRAAYPQLVKRLLRDLPNLLAFFQCPRQLWRTLRTTNVIERCFVEVRRRTQPMVCFVNRVWNGLFSQSLTGLTWHGTNASFANLHKQRDITTEFIAQRPVISTVE